MRIFIDKDGYLSLEYKRKKNITLHRYLYQIYNNCTLTPNEAVIFLNSNKRDFNKENLHKVTRGELVVLNRWFNGTSTDPYETLYRLDVIRIKQKRIALCKELGLTNQRGCIISDVKEQKDRWIRLHPEEKEKARIRSREWQRKKRMQCTK